MNARRVKAQTEADGEVVAEESFSEVFSSRPEKTDHSTGDLDLGFLDGFDVPQLSMIIARATAVRTEKAELEKEKVLAELRSRMADYGIKQEDLFETQSSPVAKPTKAPPQVKYRSPTGDEWSGRGRTPRWLQAAEAEGHTRDEYLV